MQGATPMDHTTIPQGCEQIFVISQNVSNTQKEDLAWATYILLRNTNTIAVVHNRFLSHLELHSKKIYLADRWRDKINIILDDHVKYSVVLLESDK